MAKALKLKGSKMSTTEKYEKALTESHQEKFILRLYITGMTPASTRAIENLRSICEEHLKGHYELEIVDIYQHPNLSKGEQIVATPTLIKKIPQPLRRFVGDLSNKERILLGLDLRSHKDNLSGE